MSQGNSPGAPGSGKSDQDDGSAERTSEADPAPGKKAAGKTAAKKTGAKGSPSKKAGAKKPAGAKTGGSGDATSRQAAPASAPADARAAAQAGRAVRNPSTRHFPVQMFASVLGLGGLGIAWREAAQTFGFTVAASDILLGFTAGFYIAVLALYTLKAVRHPDAAVEDFNDPARGSYFAAAGMGLLLLSAAARPDAPWLAEALWAIGTPVNLAITLALAGGWMARTFHVTHATPVWFLPAAGNLLVPIAGAPLGYVDIGWMVFAVGLLFWLVLLAIVFNRLIFHPPMRQPLRPTIVIMLAPPALACIAYAVLAGGFYDGVATMFYGIALFTTALLLAQARTLARLPFALSNWSYTFPLSALTIAATLYADQGGGGVANAIAIAALAATTAATIWVFAITARALVRGALFRNDAAPAGHEEDATS